MMTMAMMITMMTDGDDDDDDDDDDGDDGDDDDQCMMSGKCQVATAGALPNWDPAPLLATTPPASLASSTSSTS